MKTVSPILLLALLLTAGFTLGTTLQPRTSAWTSRAETDNALKMLLGDARQMFANHFFVQADVYFHAGYYPSIFNQRDEVVAGSPMQTPGLEQADHVHGPDCNHDHAADHDPGHEYLDGQTCEHCDQEDDHMKQMRRDASRDWVERFGRNFMIREHTHLTTDQTREMLPWLQLSAALDPERIESYRVGSYWLQRQGRVDQAEKFLRDGIKANPQSHELYLDLGRLLYEAHQDVNRARNLWQYALRLWNQNEAGKEEPNKVTFLEITVRLGKLEQEAGNLDKAIEWLTRAKEFSPNPDGLQKQIDELRVEAARPEGQPQ